MILKSYYHNIIIDYINRYNLLRYDVPYAYTWIDGVHFNNVVISLWKSIDNTNTLISFEYRKSYYEFTNIIEEDIYYLEWLENNDEFEKFICLYERGIDKEAEAIKYLMDIVIKHSNIAIRYGLK